MAGRLCATAATPPNRHSNNEAGALSDHTRSATDVAAGDQGAEGRARQAGESRSQSTEGALGRRSTPGRTRGAAQIALRSVRFAIRRKAAVAVARDALGGIYALPALLTVTAPGPPRRAGVPGRAIAVQTLWNVPILP